MKIIDKDNQPIADVASLPVESDATAQTSADVPADKRLSQRDYMVARLRKIRERLISYAAQTTDRQSLAGSLLDAAQGLDLAVAGAMLLPPDWRPVREPVPSAELQAGDHVVIRAKRRATYADDLTPEDMDDLVVMRVGEQRLRCHCVVSGTTVLIPAGHVERR